MEEEKSDKDMVSEVLTDYQESWASKQAKDTLFRDCYQRYRSYINASFQTTRSTLFIPESFTVIETVAPRMTAKKPDFKAIPRESTDITKADNVGELLSYDYDRMELGRKLKTFVKQGLIYGTSFMKVGWNTDEQIPTASPIDIADIFGDPKTSDWQSGYVIHRYFKCLDDLKKSKIKYKNIDQLELRMKTTIKDDDLRQDRNSVQGLPYTGKQDGIEILEHWCREDGEIYVRTIADRAILIRDEKTPYPLDRFPFVTFFDQEVPFEKWGIGEIEPMIDLQDELNTVRNQRIDEKNLAIHNMWIVSKTAGVDYRNLISKPGGIILANDINGIKALEKQNITSDSLNEINLIKQDIRNTTGTSDFVRGANTGGTTATETAIKTQESNQRFAEKISNLELALKDLGEWIVALNAEFLTKQVKIKIVGKYGLEDMTINSSDIKGMYDIQIESGSSLPANPDLRRQQLRELLQVITPVLSNPAGIPDGMREFLRTLIQSYDLKNVDEILKGSQPGEVNMAMANLTPEEMQGANPQMVEAEIKKQLMAQGQFMPQPEMQGQEQPPMRTGSPNPVQGMMQ